VVADMIWEGISIDVEKAGGSEKAIDREQFGLPTT